MQMHWISLYYSIYIKRIIQNTPHNSSLTPDLISYEYIPNNMETDQEGKMILPTTWTKQ